MYIYTLAFLKRKDEILLVNRNKQPWLGAWNGVGGKRELNESPLECIIREIKEETNIDVIEDMVIDKGLVTWNSFDAMGQGLYVFLVDLPDDYRYDTPIATREGILDFKPIAFLQNKENYGIAHNIPYFIDAILYEEKRYRHHCTFDGNTLVEVKKVLCDE